jgi:hypothetical protein
MEKEINTNGMNLYQKLNKIATEMGTVEKSGRNAQQGYAFMEQAEIMMRARKLLAKYGVTIIPETLERTLFEREVVRSSGKAGIDSHVQVKSKFILVNSDDPQEKVECLWDGGEAIDSSDKATNKAITASQKYFYIKLFNISDKDDTDATYTDNKEEKVAVAPVPVVPATVAAINSAQENAIIRLSAKLAIDTPDMTSMTFVQAVDKINELNEFLGGK